MSTKYYKIKGYEFLGTYSDMDLASRMAYLIQNLTLLMDEDEGLKYFWIILSRDEDIVRGMPRHGNSLSVVRQPAGVEVPLNEITAYGLCEGCVLFGGSLERVKQETTVQQQLGTLTSYPFEIDKDTMHDITTNWVEEIK